jgi:endoglycosylceramidase
MNRGFFAMAALLLCLAGCSTSPGAGPDAGPDRVTELSTPDLSDALPGELPDLAVSDLADLRAPDLSDADDLAPELLSETMEELAPEVETDVVEPLPPYVPNGFVGTDGRHFRDEVGRVLLLHGVNVSNVSKSAPFFPQWLTEDHVQMLADRGLNVVRFLIIWEAIEPEKGVFDQAYLDMVEEKVAWFTSRGIYVLVDMHQDLWGPKFTGDGAPLWATLDHGLPFDPPPGHWFMKYGEPAVKQAFQSFWDNEEGIRDHFVMAWQEVAKRFADNPMVIGYDLINEPYIGNWEVTQIPQFEAEVLTPFYALVAAGIRELDGNHIIFVEPTASKGLGIKGGIGPIGDDKVAYAAHYYHPTMDMLSSYSDKKENMLKVFTQIRDEGWAMGGPTFLGEFGFFLGFGGYELYAQHQFEVMEELGMSWTAWSFDRGTCFLCLLDPDGNPNWALEAITQARPRRIAGRLVSWHWDAASLTMTLAFDPEGFGGGETVIATPALLFPDGPTVSCTRPDGTECEAQLDPALHRVVVSTTPEDAGPHLVTIAP